MCHHHGLPCTVYNSFSRNFYCSDIVLVFTYAPQWYGPCERCYHGLSNTCLHFCLLSQTAKVSLTTPSHQVSFFPLISKIISSTLAFHSGFEKILFWFRHTTVLLHLNLVRSLCVINYFAQGQDFGDMAAVFAIPLGTMQ